MAQYQYSEHTFPFIYHEGVEISLSNMVAKSAYRIHCIIIH